MADGGDRRVALGRSTRAPRRDGTRRYSAAGHPAQRVILELWAILKGLVYATLAEKIATVERELVASAADPERVCRLVGWVWTRDTLTQLPPENPSSS